MIDEELKQNLLTAVTEKLPVLAVESIKNLISENEKLTKALEIEKKQHENVKVQLETKTSRVRKLEKLQLTQENLDLREKALDTKYNELEVSQLTYELKAEKEKTGTIQGLVSSLFENKNISHFVNTFGNMPVPDVNGYQGATQHPFNSTTSIVEGQ